MQLHPHISVRFKRGKFCRSERHRVREPQFVQIVGYRSEHLNHFPTLEHYTRTNFTVRYAAIKLLEELFAVLQQLHHHDFSCWQEHEPDRPTVVA